jgi:hypothetical protein
MAINLDKVTKVIKYGKVVFREDIDVYVTFSDPLYDIFYIRFKNLIPGKPQPSKRVIKEAIDSDFKNYDLVELTQEDITFLGERVPEYLI